ncbi:hypothetical protein MYK68_14990 [Gordonia sp. PP30]|uniref:hypothetical protein n=1 Tax=Gordonia sp. PP30 TaxID=2935861 RepID=UPI001FFEC069|nr:hypothetical protein [Gordonia sp. PP30]UQE74032.1 hypothetical protein MYK68_14990 [Gordonia sp. PP30]
MKKLIPAVALAAATVLTAACTPVNEVTSAPSSSATPTGGAIRAYAKAKGEEGKRQLRLNADAGIPGPVERGLALAAAEDGRPFAFSWGAGCSWVRLPDGSLWRMYATRGGALIHDTDAESSFREVPGRSDLWACHPAQDIPTNDDASVTVPYRWTDGGRTLVRVNGTRYVVPSDISKSGEVLDIDDVRPGGDTNGPTTPTN